MKIGEKIRAYRKEKRMTLEELSQKSKVALATLSRMETGKMPGTLKAHTNICRSLGISIAELYREMEDSAKTVEAVADEKKPERLEGSGKVKFGLLVARTAGKKMLPLTIKISSGGKTQPERNRTGTEKFLFSLKGSVVVFVSGKSYPIKKGDSLYFDSSLEHYIENSSAAEAEVLSITSSQK
ncbi:MAG: XRE family transcriptional regulator [Candidatus Omnitrophota bacterium]